MTTDPFQRLPMKEFSLSKEKRFKNESNPPPYLRKKIVITINLTQDRFIHIWELKQSQGTSQVCIFSLAGAVFIFVHFVATIIDVIIFAVE